MAPTQPPQHRLDRRITYLMFALLLTFVYLPLHPVLPLVEYGLYLGGVLLAAVFFVSRTRRDTLIAGALAGPAILIVVLSYLVDDLTPLHAVLTIAAPMLIIGFAIFVIMRQILRESRVSPHSISAAVTVYLLIGLLFALLFTLIEVLWPGAFRFEHSNVVPGQLDDELIASQIYFSIATLVGADSDFIGVVSPFARSAALFEALVGQAFLVIFIARLVGTLSGERSTAHDQ